MAILRFILAISVVLGHIQAFVPDALNGYIILPGLIAVQSFFIISGFYMSLIINEKYNKTKHPHFLYITNRFLRIYPIYWAVLILTLVYVFLAKTPLLSYFSYALNLHSPLSFLYLTHNIIQNLTIVITPDAFVYVKPIYALLVPQSWSLVIEVTFYLVAPFIARRHLRTLFLLLGLSILLRVFAWHSNFYPIIWNADYFFPANFIFFMLGILAYKLKSVSVYDKLPTYTKVIALMFFLLFTLSFTYIPELPHHLKDWAYFLALTAIIPLLFAIDPLTKLKLLGDLSYPIYISHFFMLYFLTYTLKVESFSLIMMLVIGFSVLLHYLIAKPIDNIRTVRYKKDKSEDLE